MPENAGRTVAVIGGGAAGLTAAIAAARAGAAVTVFEKNAVPAKKIPATGNGRCNLTNEAIDPRCYHGAVGLFSAVWAAFDLRRTLRFFEGLGVFTSPDAAGRIYPRSRQAQTVAAALIGAAEASGVRLLTDTPVTDVKKTPAGFEINGTFRADAAVFAFGGAAAPAFGTDGTAFRLLEGLGIPVNPLYPALSPLITAPSPGGLRGVRARTRLSLFRGGSLLAESEGEVQYTEYGLSGIPAMELSGEAAQALDREGREPLFVAADSACDLSYGALHKMFRLLAGDAPYLGAADALSGLLPRQLALFLLKEAKVDPSLSLSRLTSAERGAVFRAVKEQRFRLAGVKPFAFAQVTRGGVPEAELEPSTLMLRRLPGAYVCGEAVDLYGDCGGFNLQWAWSSGHVAGAAAARAPR